MSDETSMITRQEAKSIAEEAATKVLAQFLLFLDVKHENHQDIVSLREDLQHARHLRTDEEFMETLEWASEKRRSEIKVAKKVEKYRFYILTGILSTVGLFVWEVIIPYVKAIAALFRGGG